MELSITKGDQTPEITINKYIHFIFCSCYEENFTMILYAFGE